MMFPWITIDFEDFPRLMTPKKATAEESAMELLDDLVGIVDTRRLRIQDATHVRWMGHP